MWLRSVSKPPFCVLLWRIYAFTHVSFPGFFISAPAQPNCTVLTPPQRERFLSVSLPLVQTWAKLRTILSRGTCLFLHTGPSKSRLKTPVLTKPGPNPYVSCTTSPLLSLQMSSVYLKTRLRSKLNQAMMSAAYRLPSPHSLTPTREYQNQPPTHAQPLSSLSRNRSMLHINRVSCFPSFFPFFFLLSPSDRSA